MRALIVDGYVDEPGNLGVPPFLGIYPRYLAGAAMAAGAKVDYYTVDDWRQGGIPIEGYEAAALVGGTAVPGRYLTTMPASPQEVNRILSSLFSQHIPLVIVGPASPPGTGDPVARFHDILKEGEARDRRRSMAEWRKWAKLGACIAKRAVKKRPTIAEIETYRGCVRYFMGGCAFCIEPSKGKPRFRKPKDIASEVAALRDAGIEHFRLGGQTCIFSYMADGVGKTERPTPNPDAMEELLVGVRKAAPRLKVLHVDNANPAVISAHPEESEKVAELLVEHCTGGNVVALGLESADPAVARENALNASEKDAVAAIKLLNRVGGARGSTGLPELLPGINFLGGLLGESKETYPRNLSFLENILHSGLLLRRINIRQARWPREKGRVFFDRTRFLRFKEAVRERVDRPMLRRLLPEGTVMSDVYMELADGNVTFGRQMGTYPLLVGVPYKLELTKWIDVAICGYGRRSVTAVSYPLDVNSAPLKALESLPGIGRKRATRLFHKRPIRREEDLLDALEEKEVVERILPFLSV